MRLLAATAIVVLSGCATQVPQAPAQPIAPTTAMQPIGVNCYTAQGAYLASLEQTVAERRGTPQDIAWARTLMWTVRTKCPGY
jgi:hypothetical protein